MFEYEINVAYDGKHYYKIYLGRITQGEAVIKYDEIVNIFKAANPEKKCELTLTEIESYNYQIRKNLA